MVLHEVSQRVLSVIESRFCVLDSILLLPCQSSGFHSYLQKYRGLPLCSEVYILPHVKENLATGAVQSLSDFFSLVFQDYFSAVLHKDEDLILSEIERGLNLCFYYWCGLNNRNYQLRTFLHFFGLEGLRLSFSSAAQDKSVTLVFSADGVCLFSSPSCSERSPLCFPVSHVLGLSDLLTLKNEGMVFARLRTAQREVCRLVDEWEFLNTLLAVRFEQKLSSSVKDLIERRDQLAVWCLETFCDLQQWTSDPALLEGISSDTFAEKKALEAVILSSVQKVFLPASISRHRYSREVIVLFAKFARIRLIAYRTDCSSHLLLHAAEGALGRESIGSLFDLFSKKTFEWFFSFDPAPALKAFCWGYSRAYQTLLVAFYACFCFKKALPNLLEEHILGDLVSLLDMPDTFVNSQSKEKKEKDNDSDGEKLITREDVQTVFKTLKVFLEEQKTKALAEKDYVTILQEKLFKIHAESIKK